MRMLTRCAVCCYLLSALLHGESKEMVDLRAQLERSRIEVSQLIKSRDALTLQVARLNATTITESNRSSEERAANLDAVMAGTEAAHRIAGDAASARALEDSKRAIADATNQAQMDDMKKGNQANHDLLFATLATSICAFALAALGYGWRFVADERKHRWTTEAAERNHQIEMEEIAATKADAKIAYHEANTVNNKIAAIGLRMVDGMLVDPKRPKTAPRPVKPED